LERLKWESPELTELVRLYRHTIRAVRARCVAETELQRIHNRILALAIARDVEVRTTGELYADQRGMLA
jgi:hypothetical protein